MHGEVRGRSAAGGKLSRRPNGGHGVLVRVLAGGVQEVWQAPWVGCGPDEYDETEEERYQAMSDFEYDLDRDMADMEKYWEEQF